MKKVSSLVALLSALLLISSCSSIQDISISKRHYRNGYHIDVVSEKKLTVRKQENMNMAKNIEPMPVTHESAGPLQPKDLIAPPVGQLQNHYVTSDQHSNSFSNKMENILYGNFHKKPITKLFSYGQLDQEGGGNWLWTLIAILIIIWLISLLTGGWGLGGLIYILLVVALVLLLLRLLSVI